MEYSQIIMSYIESAGVTSYKLSKATGISESTFSKWNSEPTSNISVLKVKKIADFFNVTVDYLLTGNSDSDLSPLENELIDIYRRFFGVKQLREEHRTQIGADIEMLKVFHDLNGVGQAAAIEAVKGLTNSEALVSEEVAQQIHA
jgi:transcriptional regulator with XRE-family HTH domain